jgi:hypothetical protein
LDHWDEPYWRQRFDGARRVDSPDTPNSPPQLMPEPLAVQNRRLMTP